MLIHLVSDGTVLTFLYGFTLLLAYACSYGNIWFTRIMQGTAKNVVRGERFHKTMMAYDGHWINSPRSIFHNPFEDDWEVLPNKAKLRIWDGWELRNYLNCLKFLNPFWWLIKSYEYFGVYFIGIIPGLYSVHVRRNWVWGEWKDDKYDQRVGDTDFFYVVQFTYAVKDDRPEAKGGGAIETEFAVTAVTTNPMKAAFGGGDDWLIRAQILWISQVRGYIGARDPSELLHVVGTDPTIITKKESKIEFREVIVKLNDALPETEGAPAEEHHGFQKGRGVRFTDARLVSIDPAGSPEEKKNMRETWMKNYTAQQEGIARVTLAEKQADVITITAAAEKKAAFERAEGLAANIKVVQDGGDAGIAVAAFEAMKDTGKSGNTNFVWAGNPFGNLGELFKFNKSEKKDS